MKRKYKFNIGDRVTMPGGMIRQIVKRGTDLSQLMQYRSPEKNANYVLQPINGTAFFLIKNLLITEEQREDYDAMRFVQRKDE